ncbi:MAG: protein kinase domain-containing protein, partial [Gemmataceae bacterium]
MAGSSDDPTMPELQLETGLSNPEAYPFLEPARTPDEIGWLAHYRVIRLLGVGGMGLVFEAFDTRLERPIALKVLKPDQQREYENRERFLREARAAAKLRSEYVITIYDVDEVNDV